MTQKFYDDLHNSFNRLMALESYAHTCKDSNVFLSKVEQIAFKGTWGRDNFKHELQDHNLKMNESADHKLSFTDTEQNHGISMKSAYNFLTDMLLSYVCAMIPLR